jgi:hypothetical protein
MTCACPAWKFVADTHLLKLQRLQNKFLLTIGQISRWTPACDLHMVINLPYAHDYVTKLCRQQAEMIQKS